MKELLTDYHAGNQVSVNRLETNDCWNIALALGLNLPYETVRRRMKKDGGIVSTGCCKWRTQKIYAKLYGYDDYKTDTKTLRSLADDTKFTDYEYIATSRYHEVYIRYGIIYDSNGQDLIRLRGVIRRKISKRRKSIYEFLSKEESIKKIKER